MCLMMKLCELRSLFTTKMMVCNTGPASPDNIINLTGFNTLKSCIHNTYVCYGIKFIIALLIWPHDWILLIHTRSCNMMKH